MNWHLQETVNLGGVEYDINCEYRDILQIISQLNDTKNEPIVNAYYALYMFYPNFEEIPEEQIEQALKEMIKFINGGKIEDKAPAVQKFDWEQDGEMIVADINKSTSFDIRSNRFTHWWTFISLFMGIGEGQFSTVISIREKKRKGKKLDDWEKEFYRENRDIVNLKKHYSEEEQEERERLNALLNG